MAVGALVKKLQNIMREDAGVNGNAQRIEQMVWLFFLKIYDAKEEEWELVGDDYVSIIPEGLKWRNWAIDNSDGRALTGSDLLGFVNNKLFPTLSTLPINQSTSQGQAIVRYAFESAHNYMQDGILLRRVINAINEEVDFTEYKEIHAFGEVYETILKDLQSAGQSGEFYTPRAVTDFMAQRLTPRLGESVADFACGTGGFLTSALKVLDKQVKTPADRELYGKSVYGLEKKQLPYLLCATNMFLHGIDNPRVFHTNSLGRDIREYRSQKVDGTFDVVLMNPPYGGKEQEVVKANFPIALRSSETADLFMAAAAMGALAGGATPEQVARLRGFARDLGLAFQYEDDLLDGDSPLARAETERRVRDLTAQAVAALENLPGDTAFLSHLAARLARRTR